LALQACGWHLVQHTQLTVVDRGRVVAPTRGHVCGVVQSMASPMSGVGPPPGLQASTRQGHLRVPLSTTPRLRPRIMVMVDSRSNRRRWMRSHAMAHTAVVCSSKKLRLPPIQQIPASSSHGSAVADDALVVLIKLRWPDASPRCQPADFLSVGALWEQPHDQDQLCRVRTRSLVGVWVGCSRVGVSGTRPAVHGGLATHSVRVPPCQPEFPCPRGHHLRPGWGHKSRQKMC
jgi:hypothetical protein